MASKRALKKRLRKLEERNGDARRDLGEAIVEMNRSGPLDEDALHSAAAEVDASEAEIAEVRRELGEDVPDVPAPAAEPISETMVAPLPDPSPTPAPEPETPAPEPVAVEAEIEAEPEPEDEPEPEIEAQPAPDEAEPVAEPAERPEPPEPETEPAPPAPVVPPRTRVPAESPTLEHLAIQVDEAEGRARAAAAAARAHAEDRAGAEIQALEAALEREQERAIIALEELRAQLEASEARAARAEEERRLGDAERKAAAAGWLRGQAQAMRREAERQVREELGAPAPGDGGGAGLIPSAELDARISEETAQLREEFETRLAEETEAARAEGRQMGEAERVSLEEELTQEREAKAEAMRAAEERLAEIEEQALAAAESVRAAEQRLQEETDRARSDGESAEASRPGDEDVPAESRRANLNSSGFDELRAAGMSISQANRIIAYRQRLGGYRSVDDLDKVPGFPQSFLDEIKSRVEV